MYYVLNLKELQIIMSFFTTFFSSCFFLFFVFNFLLELVSLTELGWYMRMQFFENTVDPDQLASDEAIWSGSTLYSTLFI